MKCPLKSLKENGSTECFYQECAWYTFDGCSIRKLAEILDAIWQQMYYQGRN